MLLLVARDKFSVKSLLLAFDITDPTCPLEPFLQFATEELSILSTRAVMLRLPEGGFGIAVGGSLNKVGTLHVVCLEGSVSPLKYEFDTENVDYLIAIDLNHSGYADRIYVGDQNQLFGKDLVSLEIDEKDRNFHRQNIQIFTPPLAVWDMLDQGVQLYFIGETVQGKGLYRIRDPLDSSKERSDIEFIMPGDYVAGYLRFGQYWLVPRELNQVPVVLDLVTHQVITMDRQLKLNESAGGDTRVIAKLFWDLQQQKEILITLNSDCQLNTETLQAHHNPYGRLTWLKSVDNEI